MDVTDSAVPFGGLRGLVEQLVALHAAGQTALLGIVVATEGSTYQKPGALVVLDSRGMRHGVISGGCLEPALEQRAQAVFARGRAALIDFDTRSDDDLVFGSGTGCRGRVHLLLLPQPPGAPFARLLRRCIDDCVVLEVDLSLRGAAIGSGSARVCEAAEAESAAAWDSTGANVTNAIDVPEHRLRIAAPPRILLLGAGPETRPLLELTRRMGWFTTVVEHRARWRQAFADSGRADRLIAAAPVAAIEQLADERGEAAIVMSHNFMLDGQFLRYCAGATFGYIGLLGPPARRDALLEELGPAAAKLRARLHAPVGLDLGGSGPEAIALAIAAELQQHLAGLRRA